MSGRAETFDNRMQSDHRGGHGVAGGVGVEAAVDLGSVGDKKREPGRVGSGAGGGDAPAVRMESAAADGVDDGLAKDNDRCRFRGDGEEAQVLSRAGRHAAPRAPGGSAQFSADGGIVVSQQKEDGVGAGVGVESARTDERIDRGGGESGSRARRESLISVPSTPRAKPINLPMTQIYSNSVWTGTFSARAIAASS